MNNREEIILSPLEHTWIIDLDGTIVKHNGYKLNGYDILLEGAKSFIDSIPENDMIIFLTARNIKFKEQTEIFLRNNKIRYNYILFDIPYGERIILNDNKPSGLEMGIAYNKQRDSSLFPRITINQNL